jgi:hypothetical protein
VQRTLLPSNPLALFLVVLFIAGAIIFVIGTMLTRERQARAIEAQHASRPSQAEPALDVAGRIDLVERLVMVGQPWCIEQLDTIRREDPDESVREAADAALMVIGARGPHLSS